MKNRGFTTIELVVSFALISVMMLLLFELVMNIKTLYLTSGIKTELLTKQALMTRRLSDDLNNFVVTGVDECGATCYDIYYEGYTVKRLEVDIENGVFKYDGYATKLIHDSFFEAPDLSFDVVYNAPVSQYDSFFTLKLPIRHKLYDGEDFGVSSTYVYDSRVNPVTFDIPPAPVGYNILKGVNSPQLVAGMTPVKWNENNIEIATTEDDSEWYDYGNKKWANAKTADGSYWVWIPRYAYKITSNFHTNVIGNIDIKFLIGTTTETVGNFPIETSGYDVGVKDTSQHYFLHPAFDFGGDKLGFWVSKFEPTAVEGVDAISGNCNSGLDAVTTKTVKIIPNATSWRCLDLDDAYVVSKAMQNNPVYGWNSSEVDTHMMKNNEWGAVTYLTHSTYGVGILRIWNNAYYEYKTGCSALSYMSDNETTCVEYNTTNGVMASTTHNIYGIYDMSGGATEMMASYVNNGNGNLTTWCPIIYNDTDLKYKTVYQVGTPDDAFTNYEINKSIYGDAVYETSEVPNSNLGSWGEGFASMPGTTYAIFTRSLTPFFDIYHSDLFGYRYADGVREINFSFRPVVITN